MGRARPGRDDLAGACSRLHSHEMAAPSTAFAGQPGRRAGHRHSGAHQADRHAASGPHAAHSTVPVRIQPRPTRYRDRSGSGSGARLAGGGLTARCPVGGPADHQGGTGRADSAPRRRPRRSDHHRRKRAVFHDALDYAVELGLLPANPVGQVRWTAPKAAAAVNPQTVASPAQVRAILAEVARLRPELTAFFGCLYYAALRPEEAVALRRANLILPAHRRGKLILRPARAPAQHGPAPARHTNRVASSTVPTGLSGSCLSRRSWPICSGSTCASSGPCRTGGCSAAPAAASSARAPTAASGAPPSRSHSARSWPPRRWPAARTTCGMPPCPCG